jgi:phospholipid/cholesterol/gamma-HCH transport system substrate-binding protein
MENKSHALMAGLFTLLLGIALIAAAVWLGRDTVQRTTYEIATRSSVSGLSAQSDVRYRGLEVGKVESLRFDPATPGQILVRIAVDPTTPVTASTFAQLGYQGVTGLGYIQLDDDGAPGAKPATVGCRASNCVPACLTSSLMAVRPSSTSSRSRLDGSTICWRRPTRRF